MNKNAKIGVKVLSLALLRILARVERGALAITGTIDARPGPFTSSMTGTVQSLAGYGVTSTSATGALTQTPAPTHVVFAADSAVGTECATVTKHYAPTLRERVGANIDRRATVANVLGAVLTMIVSHLFHQILDNAQRLSDLVNLIHQWSGR